MNKSDKYYLKKGRLELSMLDDEEDYDDEEEHGNKIPGSPEMQENLKVDRKRQLLENIELQHTKRLRGDKPKEKIKVSDEIYSTLHTMGQYLTKTDEEMQQQGTMTNGLGRRKQMSDAKSQLLEQVASTIKVKEVVLPPIEPKEEHLKQVAITKADELTSTSKDEPVFIDKRTNKVKTDGNQSDKVAESLMAVNEALHKLTDSKEDRKADENDASSSIALNKETFSKDLNQEDNGKPFEELTSEEKDETVRLDIGNYDEALGQSTGNLSQLDDYNEQVEQVINSSYEQANQLTKQEGFIAKQNTTEDNLNDPEEQNNPMDVANNDEPTNLAEQSSVVDLTHTVTGSSPLGKTDQMEPTNLVSSESEFASEAEQVDQLSAVVDEARINQTKIDHLIDSFFGHREPQFAFNKELKAHIEKKIREIREYQ